MEWNAVRARPHRRGRSTESLLRNPRIRIPTRATVPTSPAVEVGRRSARRVDPGPAGPPEPRAASAAATTRRRPRALRPSRTAPTAEARGGGSLPRRGPPARPVLNRAQRRRRRRLGRGPRHRNVLLVCFCPLSVSRRTGLYVSRVSYLPLAEVWVRPLLPPPRSADP